MTISKKLKTYTIQLQTLTPLHIGSGEVLSPFTDFVVSAEHISCINHKALEENLNANPKLIDKFVQGVNNGSFDFGAFIKTDLKLNLKDEKTVDYRLVRLDKGNIKQTQLSKFIHSAGRPFIPGSSIKGAIRTALFFDWLLNNHKFIDKLVGFINDNAKKKLEEALMEAEEIVFGKSNNSKMRFLKVLDSDFFDLEKDLRVRKLSRVNLKMPTEKQELPLFEVIPKDKQKEFKIILENEEFDLSDLFNKLNAFSQACLQNEKNINPLSALFLETIQQKLKANSQKVIIRLGGKKTYFDNSIGLILQNKDPVLFAKFRKLYFPKTEEDQVFPKTRTLTSQNEPLGWVQLTNITTEV